MQQKKTAHVIGNGPSKRFFQETTDFTVVCNLEWNIRHDVVSIIDPQPIVYMQENKMRTKKPVWCTSNVSLLNISKGLRMNVVHEYRSKWRFNSGHQAVKRLCDMGYTDIHLWGFDSIWTEDMTSSMDTMVPRTYRKPTLKKEWFINWQDIHHKYANTNFWLHIPAQDKFRNDKTRFKTHAHLDLSFKPNKTK